MVRCFQESQQKDSDSCEVKDDLLRPLDDWICGSTARDVDSVPRWEGIGEGVGEGGGGGGERGEGW